MRTYTSYAGTASVIGDIQQIINNSLASNLTWGMEQVNDAIRYLNWKYYFNERTYTVPGGTVAQQQFYNQPPQLEKIINVTVTIGSVVWQPKECPSRQYWDSLNVITFYQDFPSFFFVFNGQIGIYPIPATNGNILKFNYKTRIEDLSIADVTDITSSQTVAITTNTTTVTASGGTVFKKWMEGNWIRIPHSSTDAANGDNQWYQIDTVTSGTVLVLKNQYTGGTVTGAAFTIGQISFLPENYQDLPLYRMGYIYYTTRFPDQTRAALYKGLWDDGMAKLDEEYGSKTSSVVVVDTDSPIVNPNLFTRSVS